MSGSQPESWSRRDRISWWSAAALLTVVVAVTILNVAVREYPFVNYDVAFNFATGRKIASGERFYVDWIDNNPPTIYLYTALVALVGGASFRFELVVYGMTIATLGFAGARALFDARLEGVRAPVAVAAWALALSGFGVHGLEFGQRDHLFMLVFVPWALLRWNDAPLRRSLLVLTGLVGLAATMKPHFGVLVVWVELVVWLERSRTDRPVLGILAGAVLVPIVGLLGLSVDSFTAFFLEIVPGELGSVAQDYDTGFDQMLAFGWVAHLGAAAALVALVAGYRAGRSNFAQVVCLGGLVVLAELGVAQQHRFYAYHFYLVSAAALVALAVPVTDWLESLGEERARREGLGLGAFAGALVAMHLGNWAFVSLVEKPPAETEAYELLDGKHENVLFVATSTTHVYAYYYDPSIRPVGPYAFHYKLPGILHEPDPARKAERLEAYGAELRAAMDEAGATAVVFSAVNQGIQEAPAYAYPAAYGELVGPLGISDTFAGSMYDVRGFWVIMEKGEPRSCFPPAPPK